MELIDPYALLLERNDEVPGVVRDRCQEGKPVRLTPVDGIIYLRVCTRLEPFQLERHPQFDPRIRRPGGLPLSEGPLAAEIYIALLCVLVDWSPGPPGLRGEHLQRPGIGHEPKVADRSAHLVARRDGVVDHEDLEDRRHA